jgi:hypothetical protein
VATATSYSAHNLPGKTVSQRQEKNLKVISDTTHGILDYLTVAIFALAPSILGLTGFAALVSYALAAIHLAMTLLTNMPLGVIKIIPMRLHALVEMIVGPVLVVAALVLPTILGDRREFFLVMGLVILAVWLLSSYGRSVATR